MELMSTTPNSAHAVEASLLGRAHSMAHRLLAGAGYAAMVAYRLTPALEVDALAHGLTRDGELVVACCPSPGDAVDALPEWRDVAVRLDVFKSAPEWSVRITSAGIHLLGTLEWVPAEATNHYLSDGLLPPRVAELAASASGCLTVIRTDRVVLHDSVRITAIPFDDIATLHAGTASGADAHKPFPAVEDELDAHAVVACLSAQSLGCIFGAVTAGRVPGAVLSRRQGQHCCPHMLDKVLCVDVDRTGVTLMRIRANESTTVLAAFEDVVNNLEDLDGRVASLVAHSSIELSAQEGQAIC